MERTINALDLKKQLDSILVLDVRRKSDYGTSSEIVPGSSWKDPERIAEWLGDVPRNRDVVIYCVRGGSVSNSVLDQLRAAGVNARYIQGGIEGWKSSGGNTAAKP